MDGDRNIKYYHIKIVQRRRRNNIVMIKNDDEQCIEDDNQVRKIFINHYKSLFALNDTGQMWEQTTYIFPHINHVSMEKIGKHITNEEIQHDVFCMNPEKLLGQMGFL